VSALVETLYSGNNPFLDPIIERWQANPQSLFGMFHDGDDWQEVDASTFMRRSLQFSALFSAKLVAAGEIVLIVLDHGVDAHAAFVGAMLVGAVPAFMPSPSVKQDAALYWRQHREVFSHTRPRAIMVNDALTGAVAEAAQGSEALVFGVSAVEATAPAALWPLPPASAIALLQHSSGTTGLKKGVQLSYQAITSQLAAYRQALGLNEVAAPRFASWLPLYHDMGLISSFLMPLWLGAPILSIDPFEWTRRPALLFEAIQNFQATHCWVPNFALLHHVKTARPSQSWDLSSLNAMICCSEPNKPEAFDAFIERFSGFGVSKATLQTCYAMAETVFAVTQSQLNEPVRRLAVDREALQARGLAVAPAPCAEAAVFLSNGRPIAGCEVGIMKDDAFVGERVVGEVCITAPYLFDGYYNNKAATEKVLRDKWLHSGDVGFLDQGELFIVGRLKDIIIVNGKNIAAHDVEAAVSRVADVKPGRAVAFGHYLPSLGSEQLVVIAERINSNVDDVAAISHINRAVYEDIGVSCGDVRLVDQGWLVKTTSGKTSRSENATKYLRNLA
jgi:acyl-CoA synthetase (AMP-forming)/AMP-acid ligase II